MSDINAVLEFDNEAKSALAELVEEGGGGGSSLPAVTADDNGKVLAVIEGKWDKADKDIITITLSETSLQAIGTAIQAFYAAALADAGKFVLADVQSGVSEVTQMLDYLNAGKVVYVALNDAQKGIVTGFGPTSVTLQALDINREVSAGVYASSSATIMLRTTNIVIVGSAVIQS